MNKEQIYDEQIFPLMSQIIEICQAHKIAMLASFAIPTEDDPSLECTTALVKDDYSPPTHLKQAVDIIFQDDPFFAFTINGSCK